MIFLLVLVIIVWKKTRTEFCSLNVLVLLPSLYLDMYTLNSCVAAIECCVRCKFRFFYIISCASLWWYNESAWCHSAEHTKSSRVCTHYQRWRYATETNWTIEISIFWIIFELLCDGIINLVHWFIKLEISNISRMSRFWFIFSVEIIV